MAQHYSNIDNYVASMSSKYPGLFTTGQEGSAVDADSAVRTYIAEQLQRLSDNGYDVENTAFLNGVSGLQSGAFTGFNDQFGFGDDTGALGNDELLAIAYTMAELDAMQQDGRISANQYKNFMNELTSSGMIDVIENHGNDVLFGEKGSTFFNMLDEIGEKGDREPDADRAARNAEKLSVGTRPVINTWDDYYNSARDADPSRAAREAEPGYDPDQLLCERLEEAYDNGLIDSSTYNSSKETLRTQIGNNPSNAERANTLLYAMEDAIALDNKELAGSIFSSAGINGIGTAQNATLNIMGLATLKELDKENAIHRVQIPEITNPDPTPDPITLNPDPVNGQPFDGYFRPEVDEEKMAQIAGAMKANYFESEGAMSQEDYESALEQYNKCVEDYGQESADAWLENNAPDGFREAKRFMDNVDALEQGVNDGIYRIRFELDEDGKSVYSVERTDGKYDSIPTFPGNDPRNLIGGQVEYMNDMAYREIFTPGDGTELKLDPEFSEFLSLNAPGFTAAMGTAISDVESGRYMGPSDPEVDNGEVHDHDHVALDEEGLEAVGDIMAGNYFEREDTISLEEYSALKAEYDDLANQDGYDGDESWLRDHPEFAEAQSFMTQLDAITHGVGSGAFQITAAVDENGETTYGIERADSGEPIAAYDDIMAGFGDAYGEYTAEPAPVADYDYGAELIDLSALTEPSPQEQFEAMRDLAGECWAGTYGNGEDRIKAIMDMGYSYEDYQTIQSMVNMGPEWDGTAESWEKENPSADGRTLAEREADFQAARSEAAFQMMTYEGSEDFMAAYNASVGEGGQITAEQAEDLYGRAAQAMAGSYGEDGELHEGVGETLAAGGLAEAVSNLAEYADEHPDAGITMPDMPIPVVEPTEPTPPNDPGNSYDMPY